MTKALSLALAQINPTVGDIDGNARLIRAARAQAADADLVIAGELVVSGYPPEDLVLKRAFQDRIEREVEGLARETASGGPALLVGAPWRLDGRLYNAALLLAEGRIAEIRCKYDLPNYGVFDEKRVFAAGPLPKSIRFCGVDLGVMICEDMWTPPATRHLAQQGSEILVVINGSPFETDKNDTRFDLASQRVADTGLPLIYVNLVGGQDELVFDGASFVVEPGRGLAARAGSWRAGVSVTRWTKTGGGWTCESGPDAPQSDGVEAIYEAMTLGLRDYVGKNRFPGVIIGLSGGIDSALTAAVAVDALGAERVRCVMMPSPFTSKESLEDAAAVAAHLGVRLDSIDIRPAMDAFASMLSDVFAGLPADITEENVQARSRGLVLMALSNKLGHMLLTTGNKSEMSVGYATLYGDMCGGFSVLKDTYKSTVFALSRWRNQHLPLDALGPAGRVIPERVITKPPTAELKAGQTDQDTLPPYDALDAILVGLIEDEASIDELIARGHDADTVRRVWRMVDRAEYKRRQAPPGVKITRRAFGRDRRYPITNGFTRFV
ncbi:MAG: NAD+ synthase [Rhodospirillales bacterium]|nr:NAD+ synthase [Rhodospirillales bacterium]